jgi:hypothetical protein
MPANISRSLDGARRGPLTRLTRHTKRSDENLPIRATLTIVVRVHTRGSRHRAQILSWQSTQAYNRPAPGMLLRTTSSRGTGGRGYGCRRQERPIRRRASPVGKLFFGPPVSAELQFSGPFDRQPRKKEILCANVLADCHVGAVEGTDREGADERKRYVAGRAGLRSTAYPRPSRVCP